jgi:hypothetical protein
MTKETKTRKQTAGAKPCVQIGTLEQQEFSVRQAVRESERHTRPHSVVYCVRDLAKHRIGFHRLRVSKDRNI